MLCNMLYMNGGVHFHEHCNIPCPGSNSMPNDSKFINPPKTALISSYRGTSSSGSIDASRESTTVLLWPFYSPKTFSHKAHGHTFCSFDMRTQYGKEIMKAREILKGEIKIFTAR